MRLCACLFAVTSDMRVYCFHRLSWASLSQVVVYLSPRLFCLTDWGDSEGSVDPQGCVLLPSALPLTSEVMTQQAAYLLENGEQMLLWIGKYAQQTQQPHQYNTLQQQPHHYFLSIRIACNTYQQSDIYITFCLYDFQVK